MSATARALEARSSLLSRILLSAATAGVLVVAASPARAIALAGGSDLHADQSTVVVKFKAGADVALAGGRFASPDFRYADELNNVLGKGAVVRSLVDEDRATVRWRRSQLQRPLPANRGDLEDYFTVKLKPADKADQVAAELSNLNSVEAAYAKPLPAPAPSTPSFVASQKYLNAAPTGLGVNATIGGTATTTLYPGIDGRKVRVADLEYAWNTGHEDLSRLRASGALWPVGTPVDPFANTNHGTAVAGIIAADRNGAGVDGVVPSADYHMVNTYSSEHGWDVADAIYTAANKMTAGDVILIEQQGWAPDNVGYAPVEIYPDVYDAVVYATAKGINVIEPAGNGNGWQGYDLDSALFNGIFSSARTNSGAIVVGAGSAGCNGVPVRARLAYSNYGSRVDMQGYGECVSTTGYGDLYSGGPNAQYTSGFSGTSSASAMVAGAAAEFSSSYMQTNLTALTPAALKAGLQHGSVQNTSANPGNIGTLPNMAYSLRLTDITKPSAPAQLVGTATAPNQIALTWKPATDNLGYVKYVVYRNNVQIATVTGALAYVDTSIRDKVKFTYKVVASDASSNRSAASNSVSVQNL